MIKPSKVIGENYLSRWHVIPRNPIFNIYLTNLPAAMTIEPCTAIPGRAFHSY